MAGATGQAKPPQLADQPATRDPGNLPNPLQAEAVVIGRNAAIEEVLHTDSARFLPGP